jgi:hypothetical protein
MNSLRPNASLTHLAFRPVLLGVVHRTMTWVPLGRRLLHSTLLQPGTKNLLCNPFLALNHPRLRTYQLDNIRYPNPCPKQSSSFPFDATFRRRRQTHTNPAQSTLSSPSSTSSRVPTQCPQVTMEVRGGDGMGGVGRRSRGAMKACVRKVDISIDIHRHPSTPRADSIYFYFCSISRSLPSLLQTLSLQDPE